MTAPIKSFAVDALKVDVFPDPGALSRAAASTVQANLQETITRQGRARVILASGNSQLQFLDELVKLGGIDWSRVTCFHMDEYLGVPADHPASFARYMRERVEARVRPGRFHFIDGGRVDPVAECERYDLLLREAALDLCCLGIGENGHLAFNDPPVADFADRRWVKIVPLDETNRKQQAGYGHFKSLDDVPRYGITLTIPALVVASRLLCLAPGKSKAAIVKQTLQGPIAAACPASVLRTKAQAALLLDVDSAAAL